MAPAASPSTRPITVAAALLRQEGRFLVSQRRNGLWEFPGGKREPGEDLPQTLAREMMEELGVVVRVKEKFGIVRHSYPDRQVELHLFRCGLIEGPPRCLDCLDWRWVSLAEMGELKFLAADEKVIRMLENGGG